MRKLIISILIIASIIVGISIVNNGINYKKSNIYNMQEEDNKLSLNSYSEKTSSAPLVSNDVPESFEYLFENDNYILYLEKATLAFAINVKSSNYTWFSYDVSNPMTNYSENMKKQYRSGISLFTYSKGTYGRRTVLDNNVEIDYEYLVNEVKAKIDFRDQKIKISVSLILTDDGLVIYVPYDEINEYDKNLFKPDNIDVLLSTIVTYPFFGSTEKQETGYIVIPDGTGALVELKEVPEYKLAYSQPIYGKDRGYDEDPIVSDKKTTIKPLPRITLPIYGIIHENNQEGVLVSAISGASYANYNYNSRDLISTYYQSFFEYTYRNSYKQYQSRTDKGLYIFGFQKEPNHFDIKQKISFLHNEDANYVGLAKKYRSFLEENNDFSNYSNSNYKMKIDLIGLEVEKGIIKNNLVVASPFDKTIELMDDFINDGIDSIALTFKTFNLKSSRYDVNVHRKLGGKRGFEKLLDYLNKNNIDFNYYVDYTTKYDVSKYTASKLNGQPLAIKNETQMFSLKYIDDPKSFLKEAETLTTFNKFKINGIAVSGLKDTIFTHLSKNKVLSRDENIELIKKGFVKLQESNLEVAAYNPDNYLFPYVDKYLEMPYSSSEQMFIAASIPLLQLITSGKMEQYSGYLNSYTNEEDIILRLIEYGINPAFVMTTNNVYNIKYSNASDVFTSEYSYLRKRLLKYNSALSEVLTNIGSSEMISHKFISSGVSEIKYQNGVIIYVNYNDNNYNYDGLLIPQRGYLEK